MIWSDAFCRFNRHHPKDKSWVKKVFQMLTFINAINFATIIIWLRILNIWIPPNFVFNIFPGTLLDKFFTFCIVFWLPFIIVNYIFIIQKQKYNQIIEKYGEATRNYSFIYCASSAIVGFATIMTYGFLDNFGF